ncbi:hypothetical protein [Nocardia niigatensis]|uniref:hypothetical protein n=1 Tax=Nocardia niigatensis TaxID=209249 RepID=UPI0005951D6F|nr:hypothetical protein [Nocardia niigatensis]
MNRPIDQIPATDKRSPSHLWEVGHEYLVNSMRLGQDPAVRLEMANTAILLFSAAQVQTFMGIEKHLGQLVECGPAGVALFDRLATALELNAVINADVTRLGFAPGPELDAARDWIRDRIADIVSRT